MATAVTGAANITEKQYAELIHKYERFIRARARQMATKYIDAYELAQYARIRLWERRKYYHARAGAKFETWAYIVVGNAMRELRRNSERRLTVITDSLEYVVQNAGEGAIGVAPDPFHAAADNSRVAELLAALQSDPEALEVIQHLARGLNWQETGRSIGISAGTISTRRRRAQALTSAYLGV